MPVFVIRRNSMRLIDADALKYELFADNYNTKMTNQEVAECIDNSPTIDAVPVVRCEECSNKEEHSYYCLLHSIFVRSDFFCKDGGCDK
jgi:hypothetical protein